MMRFVLLLFWILFLVSCGGFPTTSNGGPSIVPQQCKLAPRQSISLSVGGIVPPNARITWQATEGTIVQTPAGYTATYTAPARVGVYRITVLFEEGGKVISSAWLDCQVGSSLTAQPPENTPTSMPVVPTTVFTFTATSTATLTFTAIPTAEPARPSPTLTPLFTPTPAPITLAITEFMGNPCGGDDVTVYNQYIELYNYGRQPVNVDGLWLYTGIAQRIIAWDAHDPKLPALDAQLVTSSTIIPPGGFALILSPRYTYALSPYNMPYDIPPRTVILTVDGNRLGATKVGIVAYGQGRDVIVLYRGGRTILEEAIATYGTPLLDTFIEKIRDDYRDALPFDLPECRSANLRNLTKGDQQSNWELIRGGTPGEGPYRPLP